MRFVKFVNLTPHEVVLVVRGEEIRIPPSGKVLRLVEVDEEVGDVGGIPVVRRTFLPPSVEEFPEIDDPEAVVIVSLPLLMSLASLREAGAIRVRCWMVAPDTGSGAIRDEQGRIVGTTRFITM